MPSPYPHTGSLNQKITIEKNTTSKSASGQDVDNWAAFKILFAAVNFGGGGEKEDQGAPISTSTQNFVVRYQNASDVTIKMRVVYKNENYNIRSIGAIGRNRYLIIKAELVQ